MAGTYGSWRGAGQEPTDQGSGGVLTALALLGDWLHREEPLLCEMEKRGLERRLGHTWAEPGLPLGGSVDLVRGEKAAEKRA